MNYPKKLYRLSSRPWVVLCAVIVLAGKPALAGGSAWPDTNIPPYGLDKTSWSFFDGQVVLQDDKMEVAFDRRSGALTRLEDKRTHWVIERRPKLGVSFRLFAPLPNRNYNPVFGQAQRAAEVKKLSAHEIRLVWENLVSKNGGALPITFTSDVTLSNGVLTFNATVQNDSPLTVDTVDYPYLGDLNPPTRQTPLDIRVMRNGNPDDLWTTEIYPHFNNEHGYWGDFFPLKTREAQQSLFCLIQSPQEGLYVGMGVSTARGIAEPGPVTTSKKFISRARAPYRMQYTFELRPGVLDSVSNLVPPEDEISGIPVHLEFRTCHFIWLKPHSTMKLAPIVVRAYRGDWHAGVDLYKQWRATASH